MRPTPEEFVRRLREAYQKIGYAPCQTSFYKPGEKRCCPATAFHLASGGREIEEGVIDTQRALSDLLRALGLGTGDGWAFIAGWDEAETESYPFFSEDPDHQWAYEMGVKAREALLSRDPARVSH